MDVPAGVATGTRARYRLGVPPSPQPTPSEDTALRKATTVKPQMWTKPGFLRLSASARYVYSFLITGPDSNLTGIVRYPIDMVSMCTGLTHDESEKALVELTASGRIMWDMNSGIIFIVRWLKHNPIQSPKLIAGYLKYLEAFPGHLFADYAVRLLKHGDYDTVSIEYLEGIDTLQGQGQGSSIPLPIPEKREEGCGATSEPVAPPAPVLPLSPEFCRMPVKDGEESITEADVAHWESLYGRIDVRQTLKKMVGYWAAKPRNQRKTRGGIRRSVNSWLAKDDDRAPVRSSFAEMPEV